MLRSGTHDPVDKGSGARRNGGAVGSGPRGGGLTPLPLRANICRAAPDGTLRQQLTTDGQDAGPTYSWLSASRDGSRLAVSKATYAYVLDGSGRQLGEALPRGGIALVAQISPDGSRVVTLELLGETQPPPFTAPPGTPPLLGFIPYMFNTAADGGDRQAVARSVIDAAWIGGRLLRSTSSSQPPYPRGICLLATNTDFECERDVARDPAKDLSAPAVSPDVPRFRHFPGSLARPTRPDTPF
jgi:hypothetical protein